MKLLPDFFDDNSELNGFDYPDEEEQDQEKAIEVSTAKETAETKFDTLAFDGYYKKLLGEPERNFWMVVYGLPWNGKSTFCIGFAKYLAENMGNVLYISSEQYHSESLKQIVNRVNAGDLTQLHFSPSLKKAPPLANYDFIFIDSANAAGLSLAEMVEMREKKENAGKAFITVLQSVKSGDFRGDQKWRHLPSIVIRVHDQHAYIEKNQYTNNPIVLPLPQLEGETKQEELNGTGKNSNAKIEIEADAGYPLEELAGYVLRKGENVSDITEIIFNETERVVGVVKRVIEKEFKKENADVKMKSLKFSHLDSQNITHGFCYFRAKLEGKKSELKKIADVDQLFWYEWED